MRFLINQVLEAWKSCSKPWKRRQSSRGNYQAMQESSHPLKNNNKDTWMAKSAALRVFENQYFTSETVHMISLFTLNFSAMNHTVSICDNNKFRPKYKMVPYKIYLVWKLQACSDICPDTHTHNVNEHALFFHDKQ